MKAFLIILAVGLGLQSGCGRPNRANILLRRQNQALRQQIEQLERTAEAQRATIRSLEDEQAIPPAVSAERLENLFTTHGIKFGRLTGGTDLDSASPGDEGVKVYIVPTDASGDLLKAAGTFEISLFDLNTPENPRIGHWTFGLDEARRNWFGQGLVYTYAFTLPWQTPPENPELLVVAKFTDELTGRVYEAKREVEVRLPEPAAPATQPAGASSLAP